MARDTATLSGGSITRTLGNVDRSITSLSGSSQTLLNAASRASRKRIIMKNGGTAAGVNLNGGTAAIGGAGTITLAAGEGLSLSGRDCPQGAITVIGTAAAYFSCFEGF